MSIAHENVFDLFIMLTFDSYMTMEELDLSCTENILLRTSRTAAFTLSSTYSSSSSFCNQENRQTLTKTTTTTSTTTLCSSASSSLSSHSFLTETDSIFHSQTFILDRQRRRPVIDDPYQLLPNLQTLNDWMVTTTGKSRRELSEVHGFSEEQIAVFEESFSLLDKDGDGNISNDEIRSLMNSLGYSPSEEDISAVISRVDTDGNGSVDFDEFLTMMRRRRSAGESETELYQVFKVFDKNKDGFIDQAELYDMLSRLGEHITEEDIQEMIEEADCLDHDGKVSYEEFKAILYSK